MKRETGTYSKNFMWRILWVALVTWLYLLVPLARADDAPDSCFCLVHPSGAILRGCFNDQAQIKCIDPLTQQPSPLKINNNEWQRIASGEDRCKPCRAPSRRTASETPRGDEEKSGASTSPTAQPAGPESTK